MTKKRVLVILIVWFVLWLVPALLRGAYRESGTMVGRMNEPESPEILCSQTVETDSMILELRVAEAQQEPKRKYWLDVEVWNKENSRYTYKVELAQFPHAVLTDLDDAEIVYGSGYSAGDHHAHGPCWFVPDSWKGEAGMAGKISYWLQQNTLVPETASVAVTVTTYAPLLNWQVHTLTQELIFPVPAEEP